VRGLQYAAACLALSAGAACAQAGAGTPGTNWGVSAEVLHRRLVERADTGTRIVEETGPLLRLTLDGRLDLAGGGALRARAAAAAGTLDYEGRTQAGVPLATDSRHRDFEAGLAWRPLPAAAWGEGWLVLRTLQQRRHIVSTATARGLTERSDLVMPGLRWSHAFDAAGWRWQPSLELSTSVRHRLQVEFGGIFDDATIRGGRRREALLDLQVSAPFSPWSFGLAWSHSRQSASSTQTLSRNGAAVGTVRHPRIEIDDLSLRARRAF
jgi:hypothetical protein